MTTQLITPLPTDIGNPDDPFSCKIAVASKRMFGCQHAIIVGTIAYLDLPDGRGGRVITRFLLSKAAREVVLRNDKGRDALVPETIKLLAMPKTKTLKYQRTQAAKRRSNPTYLKKDRLRRNNTRGRNKGLGSRPHSVRIATARTAAGIRTEVKA